MGHGQQAMSLLARTPHLALTGLLYCLLWWGTPSHSGEFSVLPIRLELGPSVRSGVIAVRNDGKSKLTFQMQSVDWFQDPAGKDQYSETRDLIFYPKIMSVEPGQEGLIRVGLKAPVGPTERTYRLFIEEMPGPPVPRTESGAQINVLLRFGAPIFVAPQQPRDGLEMAAPQVEKGTLTFKVRNSGNRHQVVQGIDIKGHDGQGAEVFALTLADRYLLTGTTKSYTASIPGDRCTRVSALSIILKTDKLRHEEKLHINGGVCN